MAAPANGHRRLWALCFGLLALLMLLQLVALLIQSHLDAQARSHHQTVAFAEHQALIARDYEHTSYLALVGLAASDWELLLRQRMAAQGLSEQFKDGIGVLQHGAVTELWNMPVEIEAVGDEDLRAELVRVLELWEQSTDAQVRLLRSNNFELANNRDLEAFRSAAKELVSRLDHVTSTLRTRRSAALDELERLEIAVPIVELVLIALLGIVVSRWLIIPLGINVQELRESRGLLQAARDQLELRVQERTHELAETNERLRNQSAVLESVLESMGEGVVVAAPDGSFRVWNPEAERITGLSASQAERGGLLDARTCVQPDGKTTFLRETLPIERALEGESVLVEMRVSDRERNEERWLSWTARPLAVGEAEHGAVAVFRDDTTQKRAEEELRQSHERLEQRVEQRTRELRETQRKLVDSALAAGRAEVATNVLHNVGNVLNSVNVNAELMNERLHERQWTALRKVADLLHEHEGNLVGLFGEGGRGHVLPAYLDQLATQQRESRDVLVDYVLQLRKQIDHIKDIVVLQQKHARSVGLVEEIEIVSVVEDAVSINLSAIERHDVTVVREYDDVPPVRIHKHKVLQVLVNLISNAKYALADTPRDERRITVRVSQPNAEHVRIAILDNGCGIAPELLTSIFQHGFTTRQEGHGFGLHASSLAATEMGAALHAASDGSGRGACFTLDLPVAPKE